MDPEDESLDNIKRKVMSSLNRAMNTTQKFLMTMPPEIVKTAISKWELNTLEILIKESEVRENYEICAMVQAEIDSRKEKKKTE